MLFDIHFRRLLPTLTSAPVWRSKAIVLVLRALWCWVLLFDLCRDARGLPTSHCSELFLVCSARPSLVILVSVDRAVLLFVFRLFCCRRKLDC